METKTVESSIASTVGKLLRDNFGKGPEAIYVSVAAPFVTIYLRNFLAPIEKVLYNQDNRVRIQKTRDLLMNELLPEIRAILSSETKQPVSKVFYDWSLDNKTGVIFTELDTDEVCHECHDYIGKEKVHSEIYRFTEKVQKAPTSQDSFKLNSRTLVSRRDDILVLIEKELINSGFEEQLRLSKRKLEKSMLNVSYIEYALGQEIADIFVDWDFDEDRGYIVFILNPKQKNNSRVEMSGQ
ncbi:Na-translocating system protein MpsC family protein [Virgibacillus kekensis]|uniref:Na-translocating system protein MpsC family protein n=1 Tax=Virgibacillus kekensis TaxID=202261 RepID=A0ABV9DJ33_9BACI